MTVSHNVTARSAGTSASITACTAPIPVSAARHWPSVNRRASPAAVVEHNPGTAASTCPAASAR